MARPIILSNGELNVGLNEHGLVSDFYFPYVGLENHVFSIAHHKIGIWVNGKFSWLDDGDWLFDFSYTKTALIGHTHAVNNKIGIEIEFDDFVCSDVNAFVRNIHIVNKGKSTSDVRLFMHQAFIIGDSYSKTDTGQYLPDEQIILHYHGQRVFAISGDCEGNPFDQYTIGLFGIEGREGTYRDAEDGQLSLNSVEHGRVDSTIRFSMTIPANNAKSVHYWITCGTSMSEAIYVHNQIRNNGYNSQLKNTIKWWHQWFEPAIEASKEIDKRYQNQFLNSTMIIKSQIDKRGSVMASTDSGVLFHERDDYAYCWPRDGALTIWSLIRSGFTGEAYNFFSFCKRALSPDGYLMHKYRADGALGSSWHSYIHDGTVAPPIQIDETALVIFVFAQYYQMHPSEGLLNDFYDSLIKPAANFLSEYTDKTTGLPRPSYDLWEEVYETTTFTTATAYAALVAASEIALVRNDDNSSVRWQSVANDINEAAHKYLFNKKRHAFYKGLVNKNGKIVFDETIDTSGIFGAFMFGLFSDKSDEVRESIETTKKIFNFGINDNYGLPRYEDDKYYRPYDSDLSNWWPIASLWLAQYSIAEGDAKLAIKIIDWVNKYMLSTGMLPEQINPNNNKMISVVPLTWSQAEYNATLLDMINLGKRV